MIQRFRLAPINSFCLSYLSISPIIISALALFVFATPSYSLPLNDDIISHAKRVVLVPGSFDPINKSHIRFAQTLVAKYNADLVILIPTTAPLHKAVSSLPLRESLLHVALKNDPNISYPHDPTWMNLVTKANYFSPDFLTRLRSLNKNIEIGIAVGADVAQKNIAKLYFDFKIKPDKYVVVSGERGDRNSASSLWQKAEVDYVEGSRDTVSSTEARTILREHTELYFMDESELINDSNFRELTRIIPIEAARQILNDGLYLDRKVGGSVSKLDKFKRMVGAKLLTLTHKFKIDDWVQSFSVWYHSNPKRKSFVADGKQISLIQHIRSDAFTDSYLILKEGIRFVMTIPNHRSTSKREILRRIPIQMWIERKMNIPTPRLVDFDIDGSWMLTEYWEGSPVQDLAEFKNSTEGNPAFGVPDMISKLEDFAFKTGINLSLKDKTLYRDQNGRPFLNFVNIEDNPKQKTSILYSPSERAFTRQQSDFSVPACQDALSRY